MFETSSSIHKSISEDFRYKHEERKNELLQKLVVNDEEIVTDEEVVNDEKIKN